MNQLSRIEANMYAASCGGKTSESSTARAKEDYLKHLRQTREEQQQHSPVHHPAHYTAGGIECIDAIAAALGPEQFKGYLRGNILKYLWRRPLKNGTEDYEKAQWYLARLIEVMKAEEESVEAKVEGLAGVQAIPLPEPHEVSG